MRDRRGFGETIALDDQMPGLFFEFLQKFIGKRSPSANEKPRCRKVLRITVFEQLPHERGNECNHGWLLLPKKRKQNWHVARIRDQYHTPADGQTDVLRDRHPEHVKERER